MKRLRETVQIKIYTVPGICTLAPDISFEDHIFSFTGSPHKGSVDEIIQTIHKNGGIYSNHLRKDSSYLIVGAESDKCWVYSCYGRKVEEALALRRSGGNILIIHEIDFWDCMG